MAPSPAARSSQDTHPPFPWALCVLAPVACDAALGACVPRARARFLSWKCFPLHRTSCSTQDHPTSHLLPSNLSLGSESGNGHRETPGREDVCTEGFYSIRTVPTASHCRIQTWGIFCSPENRGSHVSYLLMLTSSVLRDLSAKPVLKGCAPPSLCLLPPLTALTSMQGWGRSVDVPGTVLGTGMQ